jgi:hypothetical protein
MKVDVSKNKRGYIEITIKRRKKIIFISTLEEDDVELETDYPKFDSVESNPSLISRWSGLTVTHLKNGNNITDFYHTKGPNSTVCGHRVVACRPDNMSFRLNLAIHYLIDTD